MKGSQETRFNALAGIADLNNSSVLDVGCGFGDFYRFLTGRGVKVDYTGIDLNPNFIEIARKAHPDANFIVADFEEDGVKGDYEWAFESGIFNLRISDNAKFIRNTLRRMYSVCNKGFAADFLSPDAYNTSGCMHRQSPEEILALCRKLSKRVILKCDYMVTEFCIYVYKNDRVYGNNTFIRER